MPANYFKTTWRNLLRHKLASLLSLTGLSVGMAAAVFIMLWVQNELNFDSYHTDINRLYYLTAGNKSDKIKFGGTPLLLAESAQQKIPEIEKTARLYIPGNAGIPVLNIKSNFYREKNLAYVDKDWFDIFHYDFVEGNKNGFSQSPYSIILTESLAKKYYGNADAIGQTIVIDSNIYEVRGIVKDNPSNSSFQFSVFLSLEARLKKLSEVSESWQSFDCQTFLKIKENASVKAVQQKIDNILLYQYPASPGNGNAGNITASLTLLSNMHFDDDTAAGLLQNGDKNVVLIFSILGFLLLAIACINYVNLTTAKAAQRSKEVSVKKILGADKKSLFVQFMAESLLSGIIALILTLFIVWLCLPGFNSFTNKNFQLSILSFGLWKILSVTLIITVVLTGIYPAFLLSSFRPLDILKGFNILRVKNTTLRKILVTSQFTVAIALVISTIVILKQLNFIQKSNEGYNRDQIFSVSIPPSWSAEHKNVSKSDLIQNLKNEISRASAIENVTVSNDAIQNLKMSMGGIADWTGKQPGIEPAFSPLAVDADFRNTFKLELKEGRWFEDDLNDKHNYILNETAVTELGLKKPYTGQYFSLFGDTGRIIGIVKDFHFRDYHQKIGPSVLINNPSWVGTFFIQTSVSGMKQALAKVETTWKQFFPREPFEYSFMDEEFEQMYRSDIKTSRLIGLFSGIAIFISCLGLFGLVTFSAEQRKKEIGIRKVLGASITGIAVLLSRDFIKLVIIAIVIASPIAWWAMNKWIEDFVYRIDLSWWIFIIAGGVGMLIALVIVSLQTIKAAIANPVKSLRSE